MDQHVRIRTPTDPLPAAQNDRDDAGPCAVGVARRLGALFEAIASIRARARAGDDPADRRDRPALGVLTVASRALPAFADEDRHARITGGIALGRVTRPEGLMGAAIVLNPDQKVVITGATPDVYSGWTER